MTRRNKSPPVQTSMFEAFAAAELESKRAHLPATLDEGAAYLLELFRRLDAAIRRGDQGSFEQIAMEAEDLAIDLNGGSNLGMCAPEGAAFILESKTRAPDGQVPLWGQQAEFLIALPAFRVRIEFDGIYGCCFPGFGAHAVDWDRPFLSETGYRSFLGSHNHFAAGMSVADYVRATLESFIADKKYGLKGRLLAIKPEYAERQAGPQP
jgi:hypothetical protein